MKEYNTANSVMGFSIRPICDDDKPMILLWRNHPEVRQVMLNDHVITEEEHDRWWLSLKCKTDVYLIVLREEQPVAVVNFYAINEHEKTAWWGFYIDNAHITTAKDRIALWLAIEELVINYANHQLMLVTLYCESLALNEMVVALHQRYGFKSCSKPIDARATEKSVIYMRKDFTRVLEKVVNKHNTYFLCSYNPQTIYESFEDKVKCYALLNLEAKVLPFAQYKILLRDQSHELNRENNNLIFCERAEDFVSSYELLSTTDIQKLSSDIDDYLSLVMSTAKKRLASHVYVFDFKSIQPTIKNLSHFNQVTLLEKLIIEKNEQIRLLAKDYGVSVISYAHIVDDYGIYNAYSHKYWSLARMPFSKGFSDFLSNRLVATMMAEKLLQARVIVLDLDNTLWKGVIGDDGLTGIQLGGDFPGNIYKSLQRLFKAYKDSGLLLCICSKNTEEIALEAITHHPEMILREDDFIIKKINWNSKVENIKAIAQELNLGLASICFIDDNPLERQEVKHHLPSVFVPELPEDPADWHQFIVNLPELMLSMATENDTTKTEQYQKRLLIQQEELNYEDKSAFIRSLQINVKIRDMQNEDFSRVYQLFTKTNQFNTATIRYNQSELTQLMQSHQDHVYYVVVKDKYNSQYEGLASLVVKLENNTWFIENFVMSCRVMGRSIENSVIAWLLYQASLNQIRILKGQYIATDRNQPVADLYQRLGFTLAHDGYWYKSVSEPLLEKLDMDVEGYPDV